MAEGVQTIQGNDFKLYTRLLSKDKVEKGILVPYQTSAKMTFKRDSDSEKSKDGNITTDASLETEVEVEFINNSSKPADEFLTSIVNNLDREFWLVNINRKNSDGKYYAWYLRGKISEDEIEAKTGDLSERSVSVAVQGTPQLGWLELDREQEDQLNYLYRGLDVVTTGDDGKETNGGTPWADGDEGTYVPDSGDTPDPKS